VAAVADGARTPSSHVRGKSDRPFGTVWLRDTPVESILAIAGH